MDENEKKLNKSAWWKQGVEVFTQVSAWIVAPIVVALIVGKSLDAHFGTRPIIFLIFAGLGFLVTIFGIVRIVSQYLQKIKNLGDNNQEK